MDFLGYDYIAFIMLMLFFILMYFTRRKVTISKLLVTMLVINFLYTTLIMLMYFDINKITVIGDGFYISSIHIKMGLESIMLYLMALYLYSRYMEKDTKKINVLTVVLSLIFITNLFLVLPPIYLDQAKINEVNVKELTILRYIQITCLMLMLSLNFFFTNNVRRKKVFIFSNIIFFFILSYIYINFTIITPIFSGCFLIMTVLVYINLENPSKHISSNYNTFNSVSLEKVFSKKVRKDTTLIIVKINKIEYLTRNNSRTNIILREVLKYEKEIYGFKNIFYLGNSTYLIRDSLFNTRIFLDNEHSIYNDLSKDLNNSLSIYPCFSKLELSKGNFYYKEIKEFINIFSFANKDIVAFSLIDYKTNILSKYKREEKILCILRKSIIEQSFNVYYQPIFDTKDEKSHGAEALVRLPEDNCGFIRCEDIGPEEFIPIAEKHGLISDIDHIVIDKVIKFLVQYKDKYNISYIDVNFSHAESGSKSFISYFIDKMKSNNLDPSIIHLEITETTNEGNSLMVIKNMNILRNMGYIFSLDDYGSGFASIDYLIKYNFDIIKIDKSILWGIDKNPKMYALLESVTELARSLNKKIVSEGVETREHIEILRKLNVRYLQGYYFSRPLSEKNYLRLLEKEVVSYE